MVDVDIVNAYLRKFYPLDIDRKNPEQWEWGSSYNGGGWRYQGSKRGIFPYLLCADGYRMSVQGHFGAYSYPQDDYAEDPYRIVEIRVPAGDETLPAVWRKHREARHDYSDPSGERFDNWDQYAHVPMHVVVEVVEQHGGLFDWNAPDLGHQVTPRESNEPGL